MPQIRHTRKASLTLIEILLVLVLLAGASFIGIKGPALLKKSRFDREVSSIVHKLELAQALMLNYRTFLIANFTQEKEGLKVEFTGGPALSPKWMDLLNKKGQFPSIKTFHWRGSLQQALTLYYEDTLASTPQGELALFNEKGGSTLLLRGFPSPIRLL